MMNILLRNQWCRRQRRSGRIRRAQTCASRNANSDDQGKPEETRPLHRSPPNLRTDARETGELRLNAG
jgi:hypothetical protein